jgi:hypothetical protein
MSDLTDWFDCRDRWTYRTKNSGEDDILGIFLNLIGATTPALIHSALPLDAVGSGLTSRMIFVYEDHKGTKAPAPFMTNVHREQKELLMKDLSQIMMLRGEFKLAPDFMDAWTTWYMVADETRPFEDIRFEGYFERRPLHLLKLSMIMSASRSNDMRITASDFQHAIDLLSVTERKMQLTFMAHGKNPSAETMTGIMTFLGARGTVKMSELLRQFYRDVDKQGLERILQTLHSMGFVKFDYSTPDPTIHYTTRRK